jgi:hypothetical protein
MVNGQMFFATTPAEKSALISKADAEVFAAWPGNWRTDVFRVPVLEWLEEELLDEKKCTPALIRKRLKGLVSKGLISDEDVKERVIKRGEKIKRLKRRIIVLQKLQEARQKENRDEKV